MGRPKRSDAAGHCYHMLNRAYLRDTMFHKPEDYDAFEKILCEALERFDIRPFSHCIMPNHWHLVVSPGGDGEMDRFGLEMAVRKGTTVAAEMAFLAVEKGTT